MKKLDRYIISSILKTGLIALAIFSLLIMAIETFMNIDKYIANETRFVMIAYSASLALSKYFLMIAAISILFSTTYLLSNLSANNEMISLYTAGYSRGRINRPIFVTALLLAVLFLILNETMFLQWKTKEEITRVSLFGVDGTHDARNITMSDISSGYLVRASRFSEKDMRIYDPLILRTKDNRVILKLEAETATYDGKDWIFKNATAYNKTENGGMKLITQRNYILPGFDFQPSLFKSQNLQISTMEFDSALEYLNRLEQVNPAGWTEKMTDFMRRLAEPFSVFVLMMISMFMNYRFKKNVLLFSIVQSLLIAVVYYVADMVFSIICKQGVFPPCWAALAPLGITIGLSMCISILTNK